jgi:hypothetical protein
MYTEQLRMPTRLTTLLALPFALPAVVLLGVIALVPMPMTGKIAVGGGAFLEAVLGACLLATLSRIRIAVDGQTLTVAFRIFFTKRIALGRIVSCTPTDAHVWGMSYHYPGKRYRGHAGERRAVMLHLTNGAQVLFTSHHADAVCAALRARRPEIA